MKRWIVMAMLLSGACTRTPAPTETSYIANDNTAAMLLEMKAGEGHEVKGTLSAVGTLEGGKLTSGSRTFSGTIDGKAVNLSIENGNGVTLATGVMTADGLELTFLNNGVSAKMLFKPEPAEQFPTRRCQGCAPEQMQSCGGGRAKRTRFVDWLSGMASGVPPDCSRSIPQICGGGFADDGEQRINSLSPSFHELLFIRRFRCDRKVSLPDILRVCANAKEQPKWF